MENNQIKKLRLDKHWSQEQLADKANVSVRTIQRLEAGKEASIETLNLVAGALGVEVKDLFDDSESSEQQAKINDSESQLQYQLQSRHQEYKVFKNIYNACYIPMMLVFTFLISLVKDDNLSSVLWIVLVFGWMLYGPLRKLLVFKRIDPKLDAKYPLTKNRMDKDR